MKYLPLIWSGIWRKRSRAVLMLLQIATAFTLFGLLQGLNSGIKQAIAKSHADRLYVASSVSLGDPLPMSILERIRSVPGVRHVSPRSMIPAQYQKPGQGAVIIAVDPDTFFTIYAEFQVDKQQVTALKNTRNGMIVGVPIMKRFGWKVGQHVTFQTPVVRTDGTRDWTFEIVGTFDLPEGEMGSAQAMIANYPYLNEGRAANRDTADLIQATIDSPRDAARIAGVIDNTFANSDHETHTMSEGDLIASQIQRVVDLDYLIGGIIGAVFFALLLVTGALMMQTIKERTPELAVLKTFGYSDGLVMTLILAEAIAFCVFSASVGLFIASRILPLARQQIGLSGLPLIVVLTGLGFAVALGLFGGFAPAWRGLRLQVAEALADR
jgi:putative ABC transport system permease protein